MIWELRVRFNIEDDKVQVIETVLNKYCKKWTTESIRNDSGKNEISYQERDFVVILNDDKDYKIFLQLIEKEQVIVKKFAKQSSDFTSAD
jgi:hypothetical protein